MPTTTTTPTRAPGITHQGATGLPPRATFWIDATGTAWEAADWEAHYEGETYPTSVLQAAHPDRLCLSLADLKVLLRAHGFTLAEFIQDLQNSAVTLPVLPFSHAGQALAWLGY